VLHCFEKLIAGDFEGLHLGPVVETTGKNIVARSSPGITQS
jgi:hypothetical protein